MKEVSLWWNENNNFQWYNYIVTHQIPSLHMRKASFTLSWFLKLYTDYFWPAKLAYDVGATAVLTDQCLSHFPKLFSWIFTAELPCHFNIPSIFTLNWNLYFVISDSRISMHTLKVLYAKNLLILIIKMFPQRLHSRKKAVALRWFPSYFKIADKNIAI